MNDSEISVSGVENDNNDTEEQLSELLQYVFYNVMDGEPPRGGLWNVPENAVVQWVNQMFQAIFMVFRAKYLWKRSFILRSIDNEYSHHLNKHYDLMNFSNRYETVLKSIIRNWYDENII